MSTSVADLVDLLRKSRLLDAARMDKVVKAQDRFPDAVTLAKELVRRGWLTREQAQDILHGRAAAAPPPEPAVATNGTPEPAAPPVVEPRRRRGGWLPALLALLLLAGGGVVAVWWYQHGKGNPADSGLARGDSGRNFDDPRRPSCSDTSSIKTLDDLEFGDSVRVKFDPKLLDAIESDSIPEVERYPSWQPPGLVAVLGEHRMRGTVLAASPDGKTLAVTGQDAFIRLGPIDTLHEHEKAVLGGITGTYALAWSPQGNLLASSGYDGKVRLWDVRKLDNVPPPAELPDDGAVTSLSFSHDGKYLIGGGPSGAEAPGRGYLRLWDVAKRQQVYRKRQAGPVRCVAFSPAAGDYRALWGYGAGESAGQLFLGDGTTGEDKASVDFRYKGKNAGKGKEDGQSAVTSVAFSPDGKSAVSGHYDWSPEPGRSEYLARAWDLDHFAAGKEKHVLKGLMVNSEPLVAFAPDNKTAGVARLADTSVALWDVAGKGATRPLARSNGVLSLLFLPRGEGKEDRVVFAGANLAEWNAHVHNAATGKELGPPVGHLGAVLSVSCSPDGGSLVTGGFEGQARAWDLGKVAERFAVTPGGQVWSVGYHPDGRHAFYCGQATATVPFVDVETKTGETWGPRDYNERHQGGITNAVVSQDGRYVLTGGYSDGTVRLWALLKGKEGQQVRHFPSAGPATVSVALSPNGKRALRSAGDSLKLLHLRCQEVKREWVGASWNTFLPDGRVAILGGSTGALWDISGDEPKEAGALGIGLAGATPGALSRDGGRLAAVVAGRAGVWDVKSEKVLWEWAPPAHFGGVRAVALSDDGRYLFTANGDGTVYVIRLPQ
jgi:WD40 repeat protein